MSLRDMLAHAATKRFPGSARTMACRGGVNPSCLARKARRGKRSSRRVRRPRGSVERVAFALAEGGAVFQIAHVVLDLAALVLQIVGDGAPEA